MKTSKSSLFLMELIIVILFFSLSSAVCVRLFFNAHMLEKETIAMTHAEIAMQDCAELVSSANGDITIVKDMLCKQDFLFEFSDSIFAEENILLGYDDEWNSLTREQFYASQYLVYIKFAGDNAEGMLSNVSICVYENLPWEGTDDVGQTNAISSDDFSISHASEDTITTTIQHLNTQKLLIQQDLEFYKQHTKGGLTNES